MASLQRFSVRGRTYWRIVESKRINGKPRPVPILYIGPTEKLIEMLLSAGSFPSLRVQTFQHGDVAALKAAADSLGVVELIDQVVPSSARSVSVGTCLLLAAIGRVVRPSSKRAWASWARTTSLGQLFADVDIDKMTSQVFWDQMDQVGLEHLEAIEAELTRRVVDRLGVDVDLLLYDTTNFFTYVDTTNERSRLTRRGHSKQKRHDLRLYGLAMAVSRRGRLPLFHQVYEGNKADCRQFAESLSQVRHRLSHLPLRADAITLVYDRGNMSRANQQAVDAMDIGYVASLTPSHHPDLAAVPTASFKPIAWHDDSELFVYRTKAEIWGSLRTVVIYISQKLREGQIRGLTTNLHKALAELAEWKRQLANSRRGPRSQDGAQKKIDQILARQHLKQVVFASYDPSRHGADRLDFWVDADRLQHLVHEVYGRRILITDRHHWSTEDIISAYHHQSDVERVFRQLKDDLHLAVRPQFHWTDHKIHVHVFTCILGLLLARLVQFQAARAGWTGSLNALFDHLARIRLALLLEKPGPKGGRPRVHWQLEETDPQLIKLFRHLVPNSPPFVYTS